MTETTLQRIKQYIDFKGLRISSFEKEVGMSNGSFASQLKNNKTIGVDKLENILNKYPEINPIWILTGKGEMTLRTTFFENMEGIEPVGVSEPTSQVFKMKTDRVVQKQSVPLYDIQATASVVALFRDKNSEKPVDHITIPNLPKCDGAIYVSGDSMYPLLKSGDIIMYKKVTSHIDNIFWGEMYLVSLVNDDGDEFVMVKWVQKSDKGDEFIKLVSENRHHQPKDFHLNNIKGLALIKASVRVNSMY
jgi:phage repressor protein C with HTH and peptisase S24 domain